MNRSKKCIVPRVESLENITLLAATAGSFSAPTGLGSIGAVTVSDVQALQQDASGGALEQYISQIEELRGSRSNIKQYAQSVIANHQVTDLDLQVIAANAGVSLPAGIALPSDLNAAQQVLKARSGGATDRAYLKVMAQINAQDVANDQQLIGMTQDAGVRSYAQETLAYDMNHLQGAQQLTRNSRSTYNPTTPTGQLIGFPTGPGGAKAASASDTQALQQDASGGALELFISQVEELRGSRSDAQQFAQTVVGDHQVTNFDLRIAAGNAGVSLPAGITDSSDLRDAQQVLKARSGAATDKAYLQAMARINAQDVANDQQLIGSTQVPGVLAYAQETSSYDMMHLQGAQQLIRQKGTTFVSGGGSSSGG